MWVSVEQELVLYGFGKEVEEFPRGLREVSLDVFSNSRRKWLRDDLIDLLDKDVNLGNELDEPFGHEDHTILLLALISLAYDVGELIGDLLKGHGVLFDLLTYEDPVNASLKSALKSNVRCRSSHESDEVVISLAGEGIHAQVSDSLRVSLCGCVEAETNLDVLILEVTIDGLRAANDSALGLMLLKVFSKQASICV